MAVQDQTVAEFLESLADRTPVPGGGATAALHVAQGAALVSMVGRYSDGPRYAARADTIKECVFAGDRLRREACELAEKDAAAFAEVAAAYAAPKGGDAERHTRSSAIGAALAKAAGPPAQVVTAAREVVRLADDLIPIANRNLLADLAAAAEAARAGAATARVNIEVNLAGITDPRERERLRAVSDSVGEVLTAAERVSAAVLAEITK